MTERKKAIAAGLGEQYKAYISHSNGAKKRGIEFKLTFAQWWGLWESDWEERGLGRLKKCMCRNGDRGAYEIGNVRIDTNLSNWHEKTHTLRTRRSTPEGEADYRLRRETKSYDKAIARWLT